MSLMATVNSSLRCEGLSNGNGLLVKTTCMAAYLQDYGDEFSLHPATVVFSIQMCFHLHC